LGVCTAGKEIYILIWKHTSSLIWITSAQISGGSCHTMALDNEGWAVLCYVLQAQFWTSEFQKLNSKIKIPKCTIPKFTIPKSKFQVPQFQNQCSQISFSCHWFRMCLHW
jgi:hypothetical protein